MIAFLITASCITILCMTLTILFFKPFHWIQNGRKKKMFPESFCVRGSDRVASKRKQSRCKYIPLSLPHSEPNARDFAYCNFSAARKPERIV